MKLFLLKFKHSELQRFSTEERVALFQLAHLHNELLWAQKHLLWVWHQPDGEEGPAIDGRVFAFASCMGRFAGILRETYKSVDTVYYKSRLSKSYHSKLTPSARDALDSLRRYYSGRNAVMDIRDKLAFHSDSTMFSEHIQTLANDRTHQFVIGENAANTFFGFAHDANVACLLALSGATGVEEAMNKLHDEIVGSVADWTFEFLTNFLLLVLQETAGDRGELDIKVPKDESVLLPFFTEA
jgi:hypothetical protein